MGQSTDAILFYGYVWDEEDLDLYEDATESGWVTIVALRRGHVDPWDNYPSCEGLTWTESRPQADAFLAANRPALDAWSKLKEDIAAEYGVEDFTHCSGECPMPAVAIAAAKYVARRGCPKTVDPSMLTVDPSWDDMLDRWLAEMGVEKPQVKPSWHLVSDWS